MKRSGRIRRMTMQSSTQIRLAEAGDAEGILAIYAPIVRETAISFELEVPTREEMQARIEKTLPKYPWLVATRGHAAAGYAYASRHRERAAYQWSVDVSVYVAAEMRRQGMGRRLYSVLLGMLTDLGYYSALAGIALPNAASVRLHESIGFRPIGIYRDIGYKLGAWRDVGWWQLKLREPEKEPKQPLSMAQYMGTAKMKARLRG